MPTRKKTPKHSKRPTKRACTRRGRTLSTKHTSRAGTNLAACKRRPAYRNGRRVSYERAEIVRAMARAAFVDDWARRMEQAVEDGRRKRVPWSGGDDLMNVAPKTSAKAMKWARSLVREIEANEHRAIESLYREAAEESGGVDRRGNAPHDFGFLVAMQALGTGVAWRDDHEELPFRPPYREFY